MKLLEALCQTPGISGREERVRELILKQVRPLVDEVRVDAMGSVICVRRPRAASKRSGKSGGKGDGPLKVMLAAHMDQIGFAVKHIDGSGHLRINNVGGFDARTLFARHVIVCTEDSGDLPGVLQASGKPIHIASEEEKRKVPDIGDFYIDLGLPAAEVKKRVRIGDMVVLQCPFVRMGKTVATCALDNRVACWLVIRALEKLTKHECEIHAVFTVQEEVGLRGAMTAAYDVKPDVGIGIDTTLAVDTPGVPEDQRVSVLGGGAAVTLMDGSVLSDRELVREFERIARKHEITYQRSILPRGGTDTAALQRARGGCRAMTLSCPVRYIHTTTEMLHTDDLYGCRDLLAAYLAEAR